MQPIRLTLLFAALNLLAPASGPLRVLRVAPEPQADPYSEITVMFDRPVAGSLDATVEAARIFRIEPAVAGKVEWRDPVTIRFQAAAPLTPGATYTVTISNDFSALDGSRLEEPYRFEVKVTPAEVLAGSPVGPQQTSDIVSARPVFRLLLSAPVDPRAILDRSAVQLAGACGGARIPLELVALRRVSSTDDPEFRWRGLRGQMGDTLRDLRRVLELRPASPLPLNCGAVLVTPLQAAGVADIAQWGFQTYGPLAVDSVRCGYGTSCPTGPVVVTFSTPVKGSEVMRHVRMAPVLPFTVDTADEATEWILDVKMKPREHYAVVFDSMLTDVFGQRLRPYAVKAFATTGYDPSIEYAYGRLLVERLGYRTLAVQAVNVDTLMVTSIAVPEANEADFLARSWRWDEPFRALLARAQTRKVPIAAVVDKPYIAGVQFGANDARVTRNGTLVAVRVTTRAGAATKEGDGELRGVALIQVTNLAVHGRIGLDDGMVWVTGVNDGKPRAAALVTLYDANGKTRATGRTDAQGLVRLSGFAPAGTKECDDWCGGFEGYIAAQLNEDRAVVGLSGYDPDLAAWRFNISRAWSDDQRAQATGAVFTERGIYRPGERLYAKAIVRRGPLGALVAPGRTDSVKWLFNDRESGVLKDTTTVLSTFGTAQQVFPLPAGLPLGSYTVQIKMKRAGKWEDLASTSYTVAEYRPPEFLVEVNADPAPRVAGDSLTAAVSARYLFGAPMAKAPVRWVLQQRALSPWDFEIPNTEGFEIGGYGFDDYDDSYSYDEPSAEVVREGTDTLDARGQLNLKVQLPQPSGRGARVGIIAVVTDANRQTVTAGRSVLVHPAAFYIGAKARGDAYFWRAGEPVTLDLIAVRPTGERVNGVRIDGAVLRREWHSARRTRNGQTEDVGGFVTDTVARCNAVSAAEPVSCTFTPASGGSYNVVLTATDPQRRVAKTTLWRWAAGAGQVPWRDETELKVDVIADKKRYTVGDTATLLIASPFTDVEAWVTIERERVLESRRIRITAGATTVRVPITEALAPNAYVSVLMVRGRSAPPGPLDDPGRPTLRVGYAELRVVPAVKQLAVKVAPLQPEYRPGDTARVRVSVADAAGRGQRAEVTLWAVDEGVLSLTDYKTPDPIELLYQPRPLGVHLASNLTAVAVQVPPGMKGARAPGGGGGNDISAILRSRFQTTAFFLGSVVTDASGNATASAKLPDNLTTFRLMAVAVTAGDRYGSGQSSLLVSRPLIARPALPRFVREGDRFAAGTVVNSRMGGTQRVEVQATARGITLEGDKSKTLTLNGAAASEARFQFVAQAGDSAHFQFSARAGTEADAVALAIPIKPSYHPLARTIAGALSDSATADFTFETEVDPAKSQLQISIGSSALAVIRGTSRTMRVYPYYCTEQVSSAAMPLIALYRAQKEFGAAAGSAPNALREIQSAVAIIARRQRADGGIGYWGSSDWTSPWLTSYAGRVLLEAKAAGVEVPEAVLTGITEFMTRSLQETEAPRIALVHWYTSNSALMLGERVAAVDLLSRLGKPDVASENSLVAQAAQLRWEDRLVLAEAAQRRGATQVARGLLTSAWSIAKVEGRRVTLPLATLGHDHYFRSDARPTARLLTATMAIEPAHPGVGPLVETLVLQGRAQAASYWNTQDYGFTVLALMAYERAQQQQRGGTVQVRGARGTLLSQTLSATAVRDTTLPLTGLVSGSGRQTMRLSLSATGVTTPVYYFITVLEAPRARPVNPVNNGIVVERWYEPLNSRTPVVSIAAGELVRVKLRITLPEERQFLVLDDPLPAGLEAVDLSLRTVSPFGAWDAPAGMEEEEQDRGEDGWYFGSWDSGVWSPFDYKELRDDRVIYFATLLWKGTYTASYIARATTAGVFVLPPAHAEEMYNPAVNGRTGGATFTVR